MDQLYSISNREQVVDTMIGLTCLSSRHRTIIAGSDGLEQRSWRGQSNSLG